MHAEGIDNFADAAVSMNKNKERKVIVIKHTTIVHSMNH